MFSKGVKTRGQFTEDVYIRKTDILVKRASTEPF